MRPITLYDSDRLRVRLAAFLDISRTALRAVAPIVDLLVRLSLAKAFFAPGMLPGGDIGDFHATWPIIAARVTGPVLLAAGFQAERYFRLARGPAGPRLAGELEALGRAFEQEASELELANGRHHAGSYAAGLVAEPA